MKIVAVCALAGVIGACSATDPGAVNIVPREQSGRRPASPGGDGGVSATSPGPDTPTSDAATPAPESGALTPFSGAPPYAPNPVADRAANHHTVAAQGFTDPAGRDCFSCHNGGAGPQFVLGGTVYTSAAGITGLADVEVRIVDPTSKPVARVHSDADGNFWLAAAGAVPPGSLVGVRNATAVAMVGTITTGGCASGICHVAGVAGSQGPIHLP